MFTLFFIEWGSEKLDFQTLKKQFQTFQKVHKKRLKFGSFGNNTYLCQQKVETEIEY